MKFNFMDIAADAINGFEKCFKRWPIYSGFVLGAIFSLAAFGLATFDFGLLGIAIGALAGIVAGAWWIGKPK